jgi:hypothetical protein
MTPAKAAMLEFMQHIAVAPVDGSTLFEIGDMYDLMKGWRVYMRVGEKAMACDARQARKFADLFDNMAARQEWKSSEAWARDNARVLRESALAVVRKNRDHIVPDGYAQGMPTAGQA